MFGLNSAVHSKEFFVFLAYKSQLLRALFDNTARNFPHVAEFCSFTLGRQAFSVAGPTVCNSN